MTAAIVTLKIWNNEKYELISKKFDIEVRENGNVYAPSMIEWIKQENRRVTNLFTIECGNKKYLYSL